jgi:hypothetical protein
MSDPHGRKRNPSPETDSVRLTDPSSSRMLANYLSDVELLLEQQRWEQAMREAADLPRVAAALADPALQVSPAALKDWCDHWLAGRATDAAPAAAAADGDPPLGERLEPSELPDRAVPALALRRLRLHRLGRTLPRGFNARPLTVPDDDAADAVQFCTALIEGTRRWYAQSACHDPTVQANLSRLAVLR